MYKVSIEMDGEQGAFSSFLTVPLATRWVGEKKAKYKNILDGRNWVAYITIELAGRYIPRVTRKYRKASFIKSKSLKL